MHPTFGKHRGMLIESLVLKEPVHALRLLGRIQATGDFAPAREEVARRVEILDDYGTRNLAKAPDAYLRRVDASIPRKALAQRLRSLVAPVMDEVCN